MDLERGPAIAGALAASSRWCRRAGRPPSGRRDGARRRASGRAWWVPRRRRAPTAWARAARPFTPTRMGTCSWSGASVMRARRVGSGSRRSSPGHRSGVHGRSPPPRPDAPCARAGGSKVVPIAAYSVKLCPAPIPTSSRPPLRWSSVASSCASVTGWCRSLLSTRVPRRIRSVPRPPRRATASGRRLGPHVVADLEDVEPRLLGQAGASERSHRRSVDVAWKPEAEGPHPDSTR